jgi:hypothetical protein
MEKLYTVSELDKMESFPFKEATIRRLIKTKKLRAQRLSPRKTVIRHSDLTNFLKNL